MDWLDDQVFASAGNDHAIHVHYADDKRPRFTFRGHTDDVTKIKWSPPNVKSGGGATERLLASVSDDGYCMIWKLPYYPSARDASASVGAGAGAGAGTATATGTRSLSPVKKMEPPSDEDEYLYQQPQQPQPQPPPQQQPQQQQQQPQQQSLSDPTAPDSNTTPAPPHTVPMLSIENCLHRLHVVSGSENKRMSMLEWMPLERGERDAGDARGQDRMILAA